MNNSAKRFLQESVAIISIVGMVSLFGNGNGINAQTRQETFVELLRLGRSLPTAIAWVPDSEIANLAVGDIQGVSIFSRDLAEETVITNHPTNVSNIAWSPDSKLLASISSTQITIWNIQSNSSTRTIPQTDLNSLSPVAWSPDSSLLTSGGYDGVVRIWNVLTGLVVAEFVGHENHITAIQWSPNGSQLASAGADGTIHVWDVASKASDVVFTQHQRTIDDLAWSPDGSRIASVGSKGVFVWDSTNGDVIRQFPGIAFVAWSPNGNRLFMGQSTATSWAIVAWDSISDTTVTMLTGEEGEVLSQASLNSHDSYIATITQNETAASVTTWDADTGLALATISSNLGFIDSLSWSLDNTNLAVSQGTLLSIWDIENGHLVRNTRFNLGYKLVLNNGWDKVVGGSGEDTIGFWAIEPKLLPPMLPQAEAIRIPGHDYPGGLENLVWNASGTRFATSAEDGTVRIWTITASNTLQQSQHFGVGSDEETYAWATDLAWSPDGNRLAASTSDGNVKIWDTNNGNLLRTLPHGTERVLSVVWSPDGSRIISDYTNLYVWDAVSYTQITTWAKQVDTLVMAWDSSHNLLALGNVDGTIQIRNASDGTIIANFQAHPSLITSLVWSHDGTMLASGGQDGITKIWVQSSVPR